MKSFGACVALGVLCIGTVGAAASCGPWGLLDGPSYEEANENHTGGNGGSGSGGAGSSGTSSGGNGGAGGCGDCPPMLCRITDCTSGCNYDTFQADGTSCSEDPTKVCIKGNCGLPPGQPCEMGSECAHGACADGICCIDDCIEDCKACDIPSKLGTCDFLPEGWPEDACPGEMCSGNDSVCIAGKPLGSTCNSNGDCQVGKCVGKSCRLPEGEGPCNDPVQCETNYCDTTTNKCITPLQSTLCTSKELSSGICLAAPGEPCGNGLNCATKSTCAGNICRADDDVDCTSYPQCSTKFCDIPNGEMIGKCSGCGMDSDCGGGMCNAGQCEGVLFPKGAYCIDDGYCASNNCTGFPRKCAP